MTTRSTLRRYYGLLVFLLVIFALAVSVNGPAAMQFLGQLYASRQATDEDLDAKEFGGLPDDWAGQLDESADVVFDSNPATGDADVTITMDVKDEQGQVLFAVTFKCTDLKSTDLSGPGYNKAYYTLQLFQNLLPKAYGNPSESRLERNIDCGGIIDDDFIDVLNDLVDHFSMSNGPRRMALVRKILEIIGRLLSEVYPTVP